MRRTEEDLSKQQDAVAAAYVALGVSLEVLSQEAQLASKACYRKRPHPDLPRVYALVEQVKRTEEALDLAALDLRTAAGEDA